MYVGYFVVYPVNGCDGEVCVHFNFCYVVHLVSILSKILAQVNLFLHIKLFAAGHHVAKLVIVFLFLEADENSFARFLVYIHVNERLARGDCGGGGLVEVFKVLVDLFHVVHLVDILSKILD